jgi:hypothetical protein
MTDRRAATPSAQLARFLSRYSPAVQSIAKDALAKMRAMMPGAVEFVYDNYAGLAIRFGPTERPSDAVISVVLYPRWVNLGFLEGALLDDPDHLLRGTGTQFRNIKLTSLADLDRPAVHALVAQAIAQAIRPFDARRRRQIDIRAISRKLPSRTPRSRGAPSDTAFRPPMKSAPRPRGRSAR